MSDYKFKVGNRVRILKMDDWSNENMADAIGKIGTIVDCDNDEGVNGYLVDLGDKYINGLWYMENSLELVKSDIELNRDAISKKRILELLQYAKEHKDVTIDDLILCVRELPCK